MVEMYIPTVYHIQYVLSSTNLILHDYTNRSKKDLNTEAIATYLNLGEGKSVGIFYDRQPDVIQQQAALYDGTQGHQVVISSPGFPVPFDPASPPPPSLLRVAPGIRNPYLMQAVSESNASLAEAETS
jgi:hypothetical protein